MPTEVQWRGGNTSQNNNFTGAEREISVNEDTHSLRVHDGTTAGGFELARADLSNAVGIVSITASGDVVADRFVTPGGTSNGFLKADGSVDSTSYQPFGNVSLESVTSIGNSTTNGISVGVITATDGNFSGIVTANTGFNIGISSAGSVVTSGPLKTLNFIGAGNTFSVDGSTVNLDISGETNLSYDASTRALSSSSGIGTALPLVSSTTAGLLPASGYDAITYATTVTLDFAALDKAFKTISLTGSLEFETSNREAGREVRLRLVCDGTERTLTFPGTWVFVSAKPAALPASKTAVLSLAAFGTNNSDIVAAIAIQP